MISMIHQDKALRKEEKINMKFELVFITFFETGHLRSAVKMAKLLLERETRLSISVIILPGGDLGAISTEPNNRLRYEVISRGDQPKFDPTKPEFHIEYHVSNVRCVIAKLVNNYSTKPDSPRIAGMIVDLFCTSMVDVADEFGVPSYLFYPLSAGLLALNSHICKLYNEKKWDVSESDYEDSEAVLNVPGLKRPYPVKSLPQCFVSKHWLPTLVKQDKNFRKMKGILINTFAELEPYPLDFLPSSDTPPVYPLGPLVHLENQGEKESDVLRWLDQQPASSVVFLCFGSVGGFKEEQVRETAIALERSGHRFLWSLRRASPDIYNERPVEFTNLDEVLPKGFFDRTKDTGKVMGWAPQVAVLTKPAIGGFITHCGWNSTLESLWFGIPTAAWPLYSEQKFNAFEMVEELGLAVEIRKYWRGQRLAEVMTAEEIEIAIMSLMEQDSEVRKRVKEISEKCRVALMDGGSSLLALHMFIEDVSKNIVSMD